MGSYSTDVAADAHSTPANAIGSKRSTYAESIHFTVVHPG